MGGQQSSPYPVSHPFQVSCLWSVLGSISPFACVAVCLSELSCLNRLTHDLDFWHWGRPWPRLDWDCWSRSPVGQRSNAQNRVLTSPLLTFYLCLRSWSKVDIKFKGQGQSWVKVKCLARNRGYHGLGSFQQKAITLKFGVKGGHYWSKGFVCVSVCR